MPTNATNYTSQLTYTLTANNGDNPRITYEQTGIPASYIRDMYENAQCSFREVQVTCDQTGELIFQAYASADFFKQLFPMAHTLTILAEMTKRMQ
jgi:hypothetical protein